MDGSLIFAALFGGLATVAGFTGPLSASYQRYLYVRCPANALCWEQKGDAARAIRHLEWVLRLRHFPAKVPESSRTQVRQTLAGLYRRAHRLGDAETQLRLALSGWSQRSVHLADFAAETQLRQELAAVLEARGRHSEAEAERDRAAGVLAQAKKRGWSWHLLRGADLTRQAQYREAVTEYKISLQDLLPKLVRAHTAALLVHIAHGLLRLERFSESLSYFGKAIAWEQDKNALPEIHFGAGLSSLRLNRLDNAERHLTAVITSGVPNTEDGAARYEVSLWQRAEARRLGGAPPDTQARMSAFGAELLTATQDMIEGRFALALERIDRLRHAPEHKRTLRRWNHVAPGIDSMLSLARVEIYLILEQPQKAMEEWESLPLPKDGPPRWRWEMFPLRALARSSTDAAKSEFRDQALTLGSLLESDFLKRLNEGAEEEDAAAALRSATFVLAQAAFDLNMYEFSLQLCQRTREMNPYRAHLPGIYGLIGDCHEKLANREEARAAWQTAVSFGIDTYRSRIAGEKLAALPGAD